VSTGTRRTMSGADAMWLHADRPNHLMVIDGIMWTEQPLDPDAFRATVAERLVDVYPVFHQRPVEPTRPWDMPAWEDDPDFSLSHHLHHATLRRPGGDKQLRDFLQKRVSRPLDRSRPLWEAWLIDGYGGGSVVFTRLHHAMADGMALAEVMLTMTDPSPDGRDAARSATAAPTGGHGVLVSAATGLVRSALSLPTVPITALKALGVTRKLLLDVLPASLFSGEPGVDKRLTWSRPQPLPDVKAIGRATDTTVNDVLIAALSGALTRYLGDSEESVDHLTTMVPVNIRPPDQPLPRELGNKFALVMLHLPTGPMSARARLAEVHRRMGHIKDSPEALITTAVAEGIGHLHTPMDKPLVDFFAGKAIGVTTNVIGPREPRYLAGVELTGILGWVPGSGGQTLGVSIFSYADTVRIGFKVDAATVPDPDRLVGYFEAELDALRVVTARA
jgi:diacylglycerol O-acyltransferase / wax synthase